MNIVLIGYRCSGKTTAGKALARQLRRGFLDTDALIERRAGCSIEEIVSKEGWDHFRKLEKRVVRETSSLDHKVIATGGGAVVDEENVKNLKRNGWIVWLDGTPEVLRKRMVQEERSGRGRPSLTGLDPLEEIVLRAAIKPIPSIRHEQETTDRDGRPSTLRLSGRFDASAIPRIVPVIEGMTALVLADHYLRTRRREDMVRTPQHARPGTGTRD